MTQLNVTITISILNSYICDDDYRYIAIIIPSRSKYDDLFLGGFVKLSIQYYVSVLYRLAQNAALCVRSADHARGLEADWLLAGASRRRPARVQRKRALADRI